MFATLLVADDGSASGIAAERVAGRLADLTRASLVTEPTLDPDVLHQAARAVHADLLVAPSPPRPESLVHGCPCAVLLVPLAAGLPRLTHVGVAYDGTASSRAAVAAARELAAMPGSPIRQLDVVLVEPAGLRYHLEVGDPGLFIKEPSAAATWVDHIAREPAGRARVRAVHAMGDPVEELADRARRWDLLMMGSRSRGPVRSLLLGSTSAKVARRVSCPVLITPRVPQAEPVIRAHSPSEARVADALRGRR